MALINDQLQQVVRRLGRAPLFTAITLFTLAIAIGANAVIFSVVEGVLLKPLPYPHPEQLIGVWHTAPGINIKDLNMSPSIYFIDREQNTTLQDVGVYQGDSLNVTGVGQPEHVDGLDVTDGTLPLLDGQPALGRCNSGRDPGVQQFFLPNEPWCLPPSSDPHTGPSDVLVMAADPGLERVAPPRSTSLSPQCLLYSFRHCRAEILPRPARPRPGSARCPGGLMSLRMGHLLLPANLRYYPRYEGPPPR